MKNRFLIIIAVLISIFILITISTSSIKVNKLGASLDMTTNNIDIECIGNKVIKGDELDCKIVGYSTDTINGFSGKLETTSNIKITNIKKSSIFTSGKDTFEMNFSGNDIKGSFDIASFTVKALNEGKASITVSNIDSNNLLSFKKNNSQKIPISSVDYNILVSEKSHSTSSNEFIQSIKVNNEEVNLNDLIYEVDSDINEVKIDVTLKDENFIVSGDIENQKLLKKDNIFNIIVTSQDQTISKSYSLLITKKDKDSVECNPELTSIVYEINNDKLEVNKVNNDHDNEIIRKNISSTCGDIMVKDNKVILKSKDIIKEYKINKSLFSNLDRKTIKKIMVIMLSITITLFIIKLIITKKVSKE